MKFSCEKSVILEAVTTTSKAAAGKSTIEALEGILLELNDGLLTITGYNLEIGIRTEIPVQNAENGSTVVNARMLCDIVRKMPTGDIHFDIEDGKNATITAGRTEMTVMCMRADEYPAVPQASGDNGFSVVQKTLKSMIVQTKYACAANDLKPAFTGCLFEITDNVLNVVAADGIRIALRQEPISYENIHFIVPAKTLENLINLLSDEDDKNVTISIDKNQITFKIDNYTMISRLINGDFLDYKKHLQCNESIIAEINCREIIEILDRSTLFINEKNKAPLRCEFSADSLNIKCETTLGRFNDIINIKYNSEPIAIGFNSRFLLEAFKASESDTVKVFLTSSATSPVIIAPMEGNDFRFLLLPMRLK